MGHAEDLYPPGRLAAAQRATVAAGLSALLIPPGADLRYLTGYAALPLERLTCLVLPAAGEPTLVVPRLERPAAEASPAPGTGLRIVDHPDGADPYPLVVEALGGAAAGTVGLGNQMWAEQVLALRAVLPEAAQRLAGPVLRELRIRKSPAEVAALREAGAAIDAVHAEMARWLRPGRTEAQVGADIAGAIREAGHATVDFVIVASGPNAASPHHEVSDRVIEAGDPVVVDIGGTMPSGYCSDSTRTYLAGGAPPAEFLAYYEVLYAAQFLSLEIFFRGFLLQGLRRALGSNAIFAMIVPYCMIHYGKPLPETLGAIGAGLILGTVAMRTKSIWGGVLIHVGVAMTMDVMALRGCPPMGSKRWCGM